MNTILELKKDLKKMANPKRVKVLQGFFKTGKGEYGEGDVFLGITVPASRKIAIKFRNLKFADISSLLKSKVHEERLIALLILVYKFSHFAKASRDKQKHIFEFYLDNIRYINNWDLVDLSADKIVGKYLLSANRRTIQNRTQKNAEKDKILYRLCKSDNLWERRIAMIATYYFIKNNRFDETLKIAEILLQDQHDLIQKAVGWMLREVGKRDLQTEIEFLNKHYRKMPRTMLRYSIEKFPEKLRREYLESRA